MLKSRERSDSDSCWNRAREDELLFVLRAHDPAAPAAIEAWIAERIRLGKNQASDTEIAGALGIVLRMRVPRS